MLEKCKYWNGPLLSVHILFVITAILTGPFQFFSSIRKKYPKTHRLTGRIYLISILVAVTVALYLAIRHNIMEQHRVVFGTGLVGLLPVG
jgi:uncharacterized membrane protein